MLRGAVQSFRRESPISVPADRLEDWHHRPGAFRRLNPPWEPAEVVMEPKSLSDGARATIQVGPKPFAIRWVAEHEKIENGFRDRQAEGPFAEWEHRHEFLPDGDGSSLLIDAIQYRLPMGSLGNWVGGPMIRRKLERMFRYRHEVTRLDLERAAAIPTFRPLEILVTGASGLIGSALVPYLQTLGHTVHAVTRNPKRPEEIGWDPARGLFDLPDNLAIDAVVHLAGENVAGRWDDEKKRRILESRRHGTRLLAETLANRAQKPAVFISASGTNCYPTDGEIHDESSPYGDSFLAEVTREWEEATRPAAESEIRVVQARIGAVLTREGALLGELLPLFQWGLGGPIGAGSQRISWIAIDDLLDGIHHCLLESHWDGPINFIAPEPITIRGFTDTLASILRRPAFLKIPAAALRLIFGEMAEETILADMAIVPRKLTEGGYRFRYPDLEPALRHCLGHSQTHQ